MALNKRLVSLLKLLLVVGLMASVFRFQITFEDRLNYLRDEKVVEELIVDIDGSWQADPIRYRKPPDEVVHSTPRGLQPDGRVLEVSPGFLTYWHDLDLGLFALGAFCYFVTALIAGARWWWLLRVNGTDVSLWETLRFTWIGIFFNSVVPGATGGDLIKALYIMKRCPGHRVQVLVSVIVDRVLGLASLALLGGIVVLFALDRFGFIALCIWGVIGLVGLLGTIAFSRRLRHLVRLSSLLHRLPHKIGNLLKLFDQAVFFYRTHKWVIAASLLAGVGNHILSVLSVVLIGNALGVGLPTFDYFVFVPCVNILSALPIGPNGWGVGEWTYGYLFSTYGAHYLTGPMAAEAMGNRGVALSVLYRLHSTCWTWLGGLFVWFDRDRVTRADIEAVV